MLTSSQLAGAAVEVRADNPHELLLPKLMAAIDADGNGTVTCEEFVVFVRTCNPRDAGARDGWRAMLPAEGDFRLISAITESSSRFAKAS